MTRILQLLKASSKFCLTLITGGLIGFGITAANAPPWLSYPTLPIPPAKYTVVAGEKIPLLVDRCNTTGKAQTYKTTRRLINVSPSSKQKIPDVILESREVDIKAGCHRITSVISDTPSGLTPGIWTLSGTASIAVWFWTVNVPWYSTPFEVIAPPVHPIAIVPIIPIVPVVPITPPTSPQPKAKP